MKSHCIIVITDKEKIGLKISLFPGSWEGNLHVVTRTGKQWVPQHIYMMPGFPYSHSVLRSQQWTDYLGTWKGFLLKVPKCLGAKGVWRIEAETRVEGSAIARRGCLGCVPSLGDFQGQDSWRASEVLALFHETEKSFIMNPLKTQTLSIMQFAKAPLLTG